MRDIIILIGCDFSRNALKRQAFGSAAFLFARFVVYFIVTYYR
nr:MAG TPA: hypothetical protein [Bacteriophage sp.]